MDWQVLNASLSPETLTALRSFTEEKSIATEESKLESEQKKQDAGFGAVRNSDFKEKEYWEQRFAEEDSYEWLLSFTQIQEFILSRIPSKSSRILIVGCGNSNFSSDLYDVGYHDITNIDFSNVVIEKMALKNSERPEMRWVFMDMTELSAFDDGSFDVILDKASMDALMVDEEDVWHPQKGIRFV